MESTTFWDQWGGIPVHDHWTSFLSNYTWRLNSCCIDRALQTKGFVSFVNDTIQTVTSPSLHHIKTKWEEDLNVQIPDVTMQLAMSRVNASPLSIRHGPRLSEVTSRLAKLYPNIDRRCERCHQTEATPGHMFWSWGWAPSDCMFDGISYVCQKRISPSPIMAIFEDYT